LQRAEHTSQPNVWGVPGGKIKTGETPFEAVLREFFEETGITLDSEKVSFFKTIYIRDPRVDFVFHMFTYNFSVKPKVKLCSEEHQSFTWETFENSIKIPLIWGEVEAFEILHQSKSLPHLLSA
jgi:8-oxo-dGTP pyrophosphatase MutT (NUDIX family)